MYLFIYLNIYLSIFIFRYRWSRQFGQIIENTRLKPGQTNDRIRHVKQPLTQSDVTTRTKKEVNQTANNLIINDIFYAVNNLNN